MIKLEIGCLAEWIDDRARFRGLVISLDPTSKYAQLVVPGSPRIYEQPYDRLVPVKDAKAFVKFLKIK